MAEKLMTAADLQNGARIAQQKNGQWKVYYLGKNARGRMVVLTERLGYTRDEGPALERFEAWKRKHPKLVGNGTPPVNGAASNGASKYSQLSEEAKERHRQTSREGYYRRKKGGEPRLAEARDLVQIIAGAWAAASTALRRLEQILGSDEK